MATDDSYEIMPYKEIVELKKQIAELQKKTGDTSSKELLESMAALTKSMNSMLELFSSAAEEMKLDEKTEGELSERIGPLIEKVNRLEEQNKTIAEGLVAIADMVKDIKEKKRQERTSNHLPPMPPERQPAEDSPGWDEPELPPLEPPRQARPIPMQRPPMRGAAPYSTGPIRVVPRGPMPPPGAIPPLGGMPDLGELPPLPPLEEEPGNKKGVLNFFRKK